MILKKSYNHLYKKAIFLLIGLSFLLHACKTQEAVLEHKPASNSREQFKNLFYEAINEKTIGNYDVALNLFKQCLNIEPENAAVNFAIAELYEHKKDYNNAIIYCLKAHEIDITNKWYSLKLAQLYYAAGDFIKSAKYFGIGITEDEKNIDYKFQYAEVLMNSGQYEKAIAVIGEIENELGRFPEFTIAKYEMYQVLKQPENAENEIKLLFADYPTNLTVRKVICQYYMDTKQTNKANALANEMLKINPNSCEGYFILAELNMRAYNFEEALPYYELGFTKGAEEEEYKLEVLTSIMDVYNYVSDDNIKTAMQKSLLNIFDTIEKSGDESKEVLKFKGDFNNSIGNVVKAYSCYYQIIQNGSNDFATWYAMVKAEKDALMFDLLLIDGQKAIDLFPAQPIFYLYAGIGAKGINKYTEAEELLILGKDLIVNNNDLLSDFYAELGLLAGIQKAFGDAYSYLDQAKSYNKKSALPFAYKSLILMNEGKLIDAKTEIEKGISINALDFEILLADGKIKMKEKKYSEAQLNFEKTLKLKKNTETFELYGDALMLSGQTSAALLNWIESQKLGNQSEILKRKIADKKYYEN